MARAAAWAAPGPPSMGGAGAAPPVLGPVMSNLLHINDAPGRHAPSVYAADAGEVARHPPLVGEARADVCIIGGGLTGLSAALHLAQAGLDVCLLEAQRVGFGASGRNGGQVGSGQRLGPHDLERLRGPAEARALWDIAEAAKALVRDLAAAHAPRARYLPGIVTACRSKAEARTATAEAAHLADRYGYDQIAALDRAALAALIGTEAYAGGVIDHGAGHLDPLALALGIAAAAQAAGARLHEGAQVRAITRGAKVCVRTDQGSLHADHLIVACNGYLGGLVPEVARKVMPINNFVIATEPLAGRLPLSRPVAVADTRFVVNYWRTDGQGRLIFGGGESYGWRFPDVAAKVRPALEAVYPQLRGIPFAHAWGGTLAITPTRLPYLGRIGPNILTASGYSGHGVALATMAGRIMAEAVAGQAGRFDVMARLPVPDFPGGARLRWPILVLAMTWYSLRDRLGL